MRIKKYYKLIRVNYEDSAYFRITNTSNTGGFFTIARVGSPTTANLKYSLDGVNWTTADLSTDFSLVVDAGANVYMKGTNTSGFNRGTNSYYIMAMDVNYSIGGNIMSIVDETNYATTTSIPSYCFCNLFKDDRHLVNAGGANFGSVTSIGNDGCRQMYYGCTSLTTGSDLSSVTSIGSRGCISMYSGCTSLTEATAPNISTWNTTRMDSWLAGTAATGVVSKPAGLDIPTNNVSGIPSGWTTEDY